MTQRVIPAAQLVPQYKSIERCNNYAVLQDIPCSPECKIVGLILLDHCLSYALTATADVPAVYLQQFWRTVSKVPDTEDTIKFLLDTEQFIYTVDMFRDTLQLPVETPKNPFVAPANIHTIEAFMNRVGYQGVVDKKFPNIPKRIGEDYHSIKDDVPLVSVYTTGNVSVRGMLIPDAFLTAEIRETDGFKEYETVFMKVAVPMNQPQPVVSTQGTNRNTPRAHRSPTVYANPLEMKKRKLTAGESSSPRRIIKKKKQPTPSIPPPGDDRERDAIAEATLLSLALHKTALIAETQENIAKVQEKLDEEEIDKMVEGNTDEESYASVFADSMLNNEGADDDDTRSKIKPESQKENLERVSDDNETEKEKEVKRDEKEKENEEVGKEQNIVEKEVENETNVEAEKTDEVVKEKEVANVSGSHEIRNEQKQTPIGTPIRSLRNVSFSDKTISKDLTDNVSPTTATTSKTSFTTKHKKRFFTLKTKNLPGRLMAWAGEEAKFVLISRTDLSLKNSLRKRFRKF
ncbi:hypothetical protein Tco_0911416 [Tanacetum coccineum]|uniref:Uncharacterized protein n=1 Tax=Tanacetum coccineum TaxID=301880 RepID=A0ABQ5CYX6_9ASTR